MSTFSNRLKQLRYESNLSLRQLSALTNISPSALHSYEIGIRNPKREALEALADVFNCDMDYLECRSNIKNKAAKALGYNTLAEAHADAINVEKNPPEEPKLSEGEKMLLELFRQVPEDKQELVLQMISLALKTK